MDPSTVLEQYTQDLSNLPSELAYLLEELREKDLKSYDLKKKIQQRDSQIHKYIKQNSSLVKHPKEDLIYSKIKEDFEKSIKLQNEKCILSNTSLFLISKHLTRLEKDIEKLEKDGVIPPIMDVADSDKDTDMLVTLPSSSSSSNSHNLLQTNIESLSSQVSNASLVDSGRKQPKPRTMKSRQTTPNTTTIPGSLAGSTTSSATNLPLLSISNHGVVVNNNNSLSSSSIHGIPSSSSSLGISKKRLKSDELLSDDMDIDAMFIKSSNKNKKILEHGASGTVTIPKLSSLGVVGNSHNHSNSSSVNNMNSLNNEEDELYCFCQQVSYGNMIACDNSNCKYEWFHYDCVGLKEPPQGIWYCPDCRKDMEDMNMKKKERKRK